MHVAVVNRHPSVAVGGSELQCDLVARGLAARGHDVTYVAIGGATSAEDLPYALVTVDGAPESIARAVTAVRPDVVYWRHNRRGLRQLARRLDRERIPLVVALAHADDVAPWPSWPWPGPGSTMRDRLSDLRSRFRWRRQLAAYSDVTAIASQREDLLGAVPYATVALQRYVPNMMVVELESEDRFDHPRPFVAWVANLKARKRPELLPGLATALGSRGIDLLVAGPLSDERYRWVTQLPTDHPNLHYLGALSTPEVLGLLASARCLAVTAMPEGFSNVMLQAWWAGTPVVSLDYDPDGLVRSEGLGEVAEGDLERFHAAVLRFADEGGAAVDAGVRARVLARSRFSPEPVLDELERLLEAAVRVGQPG